MMGKVPRDLDVLQLTILLHALQQYVDRQCILDSNALYTLQLLQLHSTDSSVSDHEGSSVYGKQTESHPSKTDILQHETSGDCEHQSLAVLVSKRHKASMTTDPMNRMCFLQKA